MFKGYTELQALEPAEYLNWKQFETPFDSMPENQANALEQYLKGLEIGKEWEQVHISANGVWGATKGPGNATHLQSYEGIGYHSCTAQLLHGFIDSGVAIVVYRYGRPGTEIQ